MPEPDSHFKRKERLTVAIIVASLALLCYFPIFLHLTSFPFRIWDESRLAISAYEMSHGGNWIVVSYDGKPDMWSTKPPLMIWLQSISIYIFGFSELSIRLPAAMAAFLTCVVLFIFCSRYTGKIELGFITVLVLITSQGLMKDHVTRTGDYDSPLMLLTTIYLLCYFIFIEDENKKRGIKFLLYFFIALTLTALCKGVQGMMFLPALLIYTLVRKKFFYTLRQKNFYIGICLFCLSVAGYYALREFMNPGYLQAVWYNEMGGRFQGIIEDHEGPFSYYWQNLTGEDYNFWYLLVPCGAVLGLVNTNKRIRNLTLFLVIAIAQYFLTISSAMTKLFWYEAPLFPLLAMLVSISLTMVFNFVNTHETFKRNLKLPVAGLIVLFLIFVNPYSQIVSGSFHFKENRYEEWMFEVQYYLKHQIDDHVNMDGYKVVYDYWPSSVICYQKMFEEKNQHISLVKINDLNPGDRTIISQENLISEMKTKFNVNLIESFNNVKVYRILSKI